MLNTYWGRSHYHRNKNSTLFWLPSDSKENYQQNCKQISRRALLEKNGWIDREITYSFNEHGYRCDSFDLPCDTLFAGCSQTMGIGLPLDVLWASRIAEYLEIPYHNISCGGSDWQHVAQRLCYWVPILKPKTVILKEPPSARFNWWDQDTVVSTCQFDQQELMSCRINESMPLIDIIDDTNSNWYRYSMYHLIQQMCNQNNVKLVVIPTGRLCTRSTEKIRKSDLARDLNHFGALEQDYTYALVLKKVDNKKTTVL